MSLQMLGFVTFLWLYPSRNELILLVAVRHGQSGENLLLGVCPITLFLAGGDLPTRVDQYSFSI
jgi:hypothetical protein